MIKIWDQPHLRLRRRRRRFGTLIVLIATLIGTATADARERRWSFGRHPVLGMSAHISLSRGAFVGIVCTGESDARSAARLVFSRSLFPSPYVQHNAWRWDGQGRHPPRRYATGDWSSFTVSAVFSGTTFRLFDEERIRRDPRGNLFDDGDSCRLLFSRFESSAALWFLHSDESFDGPVRREQVQFDVPLSGFGEAIRGLIAACPAIARREPCDD
jgi:hypothetical protein